MGRFASVEAKKEFDGLFPDEEWIGNYAALCDGRPRRLAFGAEWRAKRWGLTTNYPVPNASGLASPRNESISLRAELEWDLSEMDKAQVLYNIHKFLRLRFRVVWKIISFLSRHG